METPPGIILGGCLATDLFASVRLVEALELLLRIFISVQSVLCTLQFISKITRKGKIPKIVEGVEHKTLICVEAGQKCCVHRAERQSGEA